MNYLKYFYDRYQIRKLAKKLTKFMVNEDGSPLTLNQAEQMALEILELIQSREEEGLFST
jgi:hypothetical protein